MENKSGKAKEEHNPLVPDIQGPEKWAPNATIKKETETRQDESGRCNQSGELEGQGKEKEMET